MVKSRHRRDALTGGLTTMLSKEYDCKGVKSKEFNCEDRETWARGLSQVGGVKSTKSRGRLR